MTKIDLQEVRQELESELIRLRGYGTVETGGNYRRDGANLDRDDLAHNFASRERRQALRDVELAKVAQIKVALQRIERGTYGKCANCGNAIESGRLEIIPYALLCIGCRQKSDLE